MSKTLCPLALVLLSLACSSSGVSEDAVTHPTLIAVDPLTFLGAVPCNAGAGSLERFVATAFEVELLDAAGGAANSSEPGSESATTDLFTLPSSPPTPCLNGVGFGFVIDGHRYRVEIDGYDQSDISPRGGENSGSREMVDEAGATVTPRWHAGCGEPKGVEAQASTVVLAECETF